MARGIQINKKYNKNDIYYYEVDDYTSKGHFYIGIDSMKKIVHYYKLTDLENPIGNMDFSNSDEFTEIPDLHRWAVKWAAFFAYNCIKKNVFPDGMSRQG